MSSAGEAIRLQESTLPVRCLREPGLTDVDLDRQELEYESLDPCDDASDGLGVIVVGVDTLLKALRWILRVARRAQEQLRARIGWHGVLLAAKLSYPKLSRVLARGLRAAVRIISGASLRVPKRGVGASGPARRAGTAAAERSTTHTCLQSQDLLESCCAPYVRTLFK